MSNTVDEGLAFYLRGVPTMSFDDVRRMSLDMKYIQHFERVWLFLPSR